MLSPLSLQVDMWIHYMLPFIASLIAMTMGIRLYQYYTNLRTAYVLTQSKHGEISLLFISRLAYGTIGLSAIYIGAEIVELYYNAPDTSSSIWIFLDAATFGVLATLCSSAQNLVNTEFKYDAVKKQNRVIKAMVAAAGGYVWFKDKKGRYLFCDPTWCEFFFGLSTNCNVIGFDDKELLDAFRASKHIRHSFGDLCMNTDIHAQKLGKQSRYVECGYIGEKLVVLDVLKTPIFEDGEYVGIVGFAWERAHECENIFKDIENYLATGKAVILDEGVYYIKESVTNCKWDRPFPGAKGPIE